MSEYDIYFEELLAQHESLLNDLAARFTRKLPRDEIYVTKLKGLFLADKRFNKGLDFETLLKTSTLELFEETLKKYRPAGYFSLNRRLAGNQDYDEWITVVPAPSRDIDLMIMFRDLKWQVTPLQWNIMEGIFSGGSLQEVAEDCWLSYSRMLYEVQGIRDVMVQSFGEEIFS